MSENVLTADLLRKFIDNLKNSPPKMFQPITIPISSEAQFDLMESSFKGFAEGSMVIFTSIGLYNTLKRKGKIK